MLINEKDIQPILDLGTWLGRKQAFGLLAGKCSAADAECLRELRQNKRYRLLQMNWEEFCRKHIGISRALADRLIRQLEEFGPAFFQLGALLRITPEAYRMIAGAITESGLTYNGEAIPLTEQNGPKLVEAVEALCRQPDAPAPSGPREAECALARAEKLLQRAIDVYGQLCVMNLDMMGKSRLVASLENAKAALDRMVGAI